MTKLPSDDQQLQQFLHQYRPLPPEAKPNLEEQLMSKIATARQPVRKRQMCAISSVITAGLVMAWSGYYILSISSESANLETFLENNWNDVVGERMLSLQSSNMPVDFMPQ